MQGGHGADSYEEFVAGVLFDRLATNVMLPDYDNGQYETYREFPNKLPNVPARLLVIAIKGKHWFLYDQPFVVGTNNIFTAKMQQVSNKEIDKLIKQPEFKMPLVDTRPYLPFQTQ